MISLVRRVYQVSLAFTGMAVVAALFIPDVSMHMTDSVAVTLQNDPSKKKDEKYI
jgi:hypothetical protein